MRFSKVVAAITLGLGIVSAAPVLELNTRSDVLESTNLDLDAIVNTIRSLDETMNAPVKGGASLHKRDLGKRDGSAFAARLLQHFEDAGMKDDFIDKVARAPAFAFHLTESFKRNLADNKISVLVVQRALDKANLLPRFLEDALHDDDLKNSVLTHAKRLYEEGTLELDMSSPIRKRDFAFAELLSKRDASIITAIINYLQSSNLLENIASYIFNNPQLIQAGEKLIVSAVQNIDWASLFTTLKNSGIAQQLVSNLLSKRDLQVMLGDIVNEKAKRAALEDPSVAVSASAAAAVGASSETSVAPAVAAPVPSSALPIVDSAVALDTKNTIVASVPTSLFGDDTPTATSVDSSVTDILGLLGGGLSNASLSSAVGPVVSKPTGVSLVQVSTKASKTYSSSTSTATDSIIGDLLDSLFGGSSTSNSTTKPSATSASSTSTSTDSIVGDLLGALLGNSSTSPSSPATKSGSSESLGSLFSGLLGTLFGPSNITAPNSSSSGSDVSLSSLFSDILGSLFAGSSSDSTSSLDSSGGSFSFSSLLGSLFSSLFSGSSSTLASNTDSTSGGSEFSFSSLLGSIFSSLFGGLSSDGSSGSGFSFSSLFSSVYSWLFGGSSSGGSSFFSTLLSELFSGNSTGGGSFSISSLLGDIFETLISSGTLESLLEEGLDLFLGNGTGTDLLDGLIADLFGGSSGSGASLTSIFDDLLNSTSTGSSSGGGLLSSIFTDLIDSLLDGGSSTPSTPKTSAVSSSSSAFASTGKKCCSKTGLKKRKAMKKRQLKKKVTQNFKKALIQRRAEISPVQFIKMI